ALFNKNTVLIYRTVSQKQSSGICSGSFFASCPVYPAAKAQVHPFFGEARPVPSPVPRPGGVRAAADVGHR
ncbi:hypothetical protein, partial [Alistipes shahii]